MLLVTGIDLWVHYRPSAFYGDATVQLVHRWTSRAAIATALVATVLAIADDLRRRVRLVAGPATWLLVAVGSVTGYAIAWDQLALWAVTVGGDVDGFGRALGSQTRFVIVDGVEVQGTTFGRWAFAHVALLPALTVVAGAVVWRSLGRPARVAPEERDEPVLG